MSRLYKAENKPTGRNSIKSQVADIWFNPVDDEIKQKAMIDAVNKFNAVWPERTSYIVYNTGGGLSDWPDGDDIDLLATPQWKILCTKPEFNQYIKDMKKQVKPDDKPVFTQAMVDNGDLPSVGMECMVYDLNSDEFHKCKLLMIHKKSFVWDSGDWDRAFVTPDYTEIKPIPTKPEFNQYIKDMKKQVKPDDKPVFTQAMVDNGDLPSVGMECMVYDLNSDEFHKCKLLMIHKKSFVWDSGDWDRAFVTPDYTEIKPIPTKPDLIDGAAYQFDFKGLGGSEVNLIGICHTSMKHGVEHVMFESPVNNSKWNAEYCTNIKLLTPEGE